MGNGGNKRLRRSKKKWLYSFFRYMASPKRIAGIARIAPKPGACVWLGVGASVTIVVGISVREGVGTVVLTIVCVVT
jgi:uncharacterized membrane protein